MQCTCARGTTAKCIENQTVWKIKTTKTKFVVCSDTNSAVNDECLYKFTDTYKHESMKIHTLTEQAHHQ